MNILAILAVLIVLVLVALVAMRAIGGNIALVSDWKAAWKYYSTWGMAVVAFLPDLWNAVIAGGYLNDGDVPETFSWAIKIGLVLTFVIKQIKQVKRPDLPKLYQP